MNYILSTQESAQKEKAFKKLMRKWLTMKGTEKKATLLLEKQALLKPRKGAGRRSEA